MITYYSIPTPAGEAELAGALAARQTVEFTHMAIGDGNGAPVNPDGRTDLVHRVDLVPITSVTQDAENPNRIVLEAVIPENKGGYVVRELAVIGGRTPDTALAVGNHPAVEKPAPDSGVPEAMIVRMVVEFAHGTAAISLVVNSMAYITHQDVLNQLALHEASADPHPQYLTKAEADAFYDSIGLAADAIEQDAARLSAHVAAADPHPQYMTLKRTAQNWAETFFNYS